MKCVEKNVNCLCVRCLRALLESSHRVLKQISPSGEELSVAESDVASDDSEKEVVKACVSYRRRFSLM